MHSRYRHPHRASESPDRGVRHAPHLGRAVQGLRAHVRKQRRRPSVGTIISFQWVRVIARQRDFGA